MKIRLLSDLHLEFGDFALPASDADITLLAGDISLGLKGLDFARNIPGQVFYVLGNHEYYRGQNFHDLIPALKAAARGSNVHVLENDAVVVDDTRILGCTLWTDFNLLGEDKFPDALIEANAFLNDYRGQIFAGNRRLNPADTALAHDRSIDWLKSQLAQPFQGQTVVLTHHAPTEKSLLPRPRRRPLAAAFASNLDSLIANHDIALWAHGHTHHPVDFTLHQTRILSNPKGYPHEPVQGFNPTLAISL